MEIVNGVLIKADELDIVDGVLEIPEGVEQIAPNACRNVFNLNVVKLPKSLQKIGKGAFLDCQDLQQVDNTASLERIDDLAFSGCEQLHSIELGAVASIGNEAFRDCKNLYSVELNCKEVGLGVFKNCENLVEAHFGDTAIVGEEMFSDCRALVYVDSHNGLSEVKDNAFSGCKNLLAIGINSKANISANAFNNSNILSLSILDKNCEFNSDYPLMWIKVNSGVECAFGNGSIRQIDYLDFDKGEYSFNLDDLRGKIKDIDYVFENLPIKDIARWVDLDAKVQGIKKEQVRLPQAEAMMLLHNDDDKIEFLQNLGKYNKVSGKYRALNINDRMQILKLCKLLGIFENDEKQFVAGANVLSKDLPEFIDEMSGTQLKDYKGTHFLITDWFKNIKYPQNFSKKRAKFFVENYKSMLKDNKVDMLALSINDFENLSKSANNLDIEKIKQIYMRDLPPGMSERQKQLAKIMIMQGEYSADSFSKLNDIMTKAERSYPNIFDKIDDVQKQIDEQMRTKATHLVDELDANIQFEWLDKDSPYNLLIGNICGCCARLGREGEDIMVKSALNSSVQTMALKKKDGEYMGKATVYVNREKGYAVFNNLELNRNYATRAKQKDFDEVMDAFMRGAKAFVETYNKNNPDDQLEVVTIGADRNKIIEQVRSRLEKSPRIYKSIEFEGYKKGGDSGKEQFIVYKGK